MQNHDFVLVMLLTVDIDGKSGIIIVNKIYDFLKPLKKKAGYVEIRDP